MKTFGALATDSGVFCVGSKVFHAMSTCFGGFRTFAKNLVTWKSSTKLSVKSPYVELMILDPVYIQLFISQGK